jgi:PAS domain-containing protein
MIWKDSQNLEVVPLNNGNLPFNAALYASEMALWSMDPASGDLDFSSYFYAELSELADKLSRLDELLALMSAADVYIFQKNFSHTSGEKSAQMRSCEVCLTALVSAPRLRFIGRLVLVASTSITEHFIFQGVVVSSQHWLANLGPEYVQCLLASLFADSPIPSFVTDAHGIVLQQNHAFEKLFSLTPRQSTKAIGHYNVLRDKTTNNIPKLHKKVKRVYDAGEIQSFEVNYSLGNVHKNKLLSDINLYLRVSLLPMRDRYGKVARVLVQLQNFSREQDVSHALEQQDKLLYSVQ